MSAPPMRDLTQRQAIAALDMALSFFGDPNTVPVNMRAEAAQSCVELGCTTEEAALALAFHLTGGTAAALMHPITTEWRIQRKVAPQVWKRLVEKCPHGNLLVSEEQVTRLRATREELMAEIDRDLSGA